MQIELLSSPWKDFLSEIDNQLTEQVDFHCLGGFVIKMLYGIPRTTEDIDVITIAPIMNRLRLLELAGIGTKLHQKYRVYLDYVTVLTALPEDYDQRLAEMFSNTFHYIRLYALDPYDLILSKLERNTQKDREDVKYLARKTNMDLSLLKNRYEVEMRPYFGAPEKHDTTLRIWIEMIEEERTK
jgi:hypothetical protein